MGNYLQAVEPQRSRGLLRERLVNLLNAIEFQVKNVLLLKNLFHYTTVTVKKRVVVTSKVSQRVSEYSTEKETVW